MCTQESGKRRTQFSCLNTTGCVLNGINSITLTRTRRKRGARKIFSYEVARQTNLYRLECLSLKIQSNLLVCVLTKKDEQTQSDWLQSSPNGVEPFSVSFIIFGGPKNSFIILTQFMWFGIAHIPPKDNRCWTLFECHFEDLSFAYTTSPPFPMENKDMTGLFMGYDYQTVERHNNP